MILTIYHLSPSVSDNSIPYILPSSRSYELSNLQHDTLRLSAIQKRVAGYAGLKRQLKRLCWDEAKLIRHSVQEGNLLGHGGEGYVFSIPKIPRYVIKVRHHSNEFYETGLETIRKPEELQDGYIYPESDLGRIKNSRYVFPEIQSVADPFPELNFGQPVAAIGNIQILKAQVGSSLIIPKFAEVNYDIERYYKGVLNHLKRLAIIPPSSFINLGQQIKRISEAGYTIDADQSNILFNDTTQQFELFDVNWKLKYCKPTCDFFSILYFMFLQISPGENLVQNMPESHELLINVIEKCISTYKETGFPQDPEDIEAVREQLLYFGLQEFEFSSLLANLSLSP